MNFDGRSLTGKCDWLTPPAIIAALGVFDLDPCAPRQRPWPTAKRHYDKVMDGLQLPWRGRVWLNPPYGQDTLKWMRLMAAHNHGTALIFARTETRVFFECVWPKASALLFLRGRLRFFNSDGTQSQFSGGAPSVLIAYGETDKLCLQECKLSGAFIGSRLLFV